MNHYEIFHQLHHGPQPFILANAWNAKSAQIAAAAGFKAIATSSGAIADSMGYPDGEKMPFQELLYIVQRIKSVTSIPLSVDMERGYTDDLKQLNRHIQQLLDMGVAGINIEDAQGPDAYLKKLSSIKSYLEQTSQHLFINARTDVLLQQPGAPVEEILKRAALYKNAGADSLFVTGVQDTDTIKTITAGTDLPVNVVAMPGFPAIATLAACGVKRVSMAAFLYRATYRQAAAIAAQIAAGNTFSLLH